VESSRLHGRSIYIGGSDSVQVITVDDERNSVLAEKVRGRSIRSVRDDLVDVAACLDHCHTLREGHDGLPLIGGDRLVGKHTDHQVVAELPGASQQSYMPGMEEVADHVDVDAGRLGHAGGGAEVVTRSGYVAGRR
jgi:hypothetical protein